MNVTRIIMEIISIIDDNLYHYMFPNIFACMFIRIVAVNVIGQEIVNDLFLILHYFLEKQKLMSQSLFILKDLKGPNTIYWNHLAIKLVIQTSLLVNFLNTYLDLISSNNTKRI